MLLVSIYYTVLQYAALCYGVAVALCGL